MRKVTLICVGTLKERYFVDAFREYEKRIGKFFDFQVIELPETRLNGGSKGDIERVIKSEGDAILAKIKNRAVIALAVEGESVDSPKFAKIIADKTDFGELCFVIGGSYGLDARVKNLGKSISFGALTYPHQLMRVLFAEQLYRAGTILNNIEYHK